MTTNTSIQHYKSILRTIFDNSPLISQTSKSIDGQVITSLTPTYLCLQCPSTLSEEDRTKHGNKKSHRFCTFDVVLRWLEIPTDRSSTDVDSRSGALYCQMCDDIVWDPTIEDLRLKKIGTGTFTSGEQLLMSFPNTLYP